MDTRAELKKLIKEAEAELKESDRNIAEARQKKCILEAALRCKRGASTTKMINEHIEKHEKGLKELDEIREVIETRLSNTRSVLNALEPEEQAEKDEQKKEGEDEQMRETE
ncbi:hypothetical protein Hte_007071 [Hypoxylon texense]